MSICLFFKCFNCVSQSSEFWSRLTISHQKNKNKFVIEGQFRDHFKTRFSDSDQVLLSARIWIDWNFRNRVFLRFYPIAMFYREVEELEKP